jgi:SAM-dependent methyltransferase
MTDTVTMVGARSGRRLALELEAWTDAATAAERELVLALPTPVLDVGCGPGRIAAALTASGVPALGIDASPSAVQVARRTGAVALCRSIFEPLPREGSWGSALLFDGNVGIGGDPRRLLRRVRSLLRGDGVALVEVEPPGRPSVRDRVRLCDGSGGAGPWFPWAWVGADAIADLATSSGFATCTVTGLDDRWFARLRVARSPRGTRFA